MLEHGPRRISPFFIPATIINLASGYVSIRTGAKGPNSATATACTTSAHSIGDSFRMIQRGDADAMICGGAEACITPMGIGGFAAMRALSTRNDEPERASRPWDKDRDGFVVGEGAGILILEELETAKRRGARILAEIVGYGMSADAFHVTAPPEDGDGAFRVMRNAIRDAGIEPAQIDYINAHGTSTALGDRIETMAIKRCFGDHAYKVAVSSTKSMTGHLLGGAGGLEAGITVLAIRDQVAPPTINYETPDPECDLDYVPNHARPMRIELRAVQFVRLRRHQRRAHFQTLHGVIPVKIVVCIKQVPARDSLLRVDASRAWIQEADLSYEINEPDAYALEEGLQFKEKHGGEVVVLCAGPARAAQTIREALAKGADRAIHIEEENLGAFDPLGLARLMAAALAGGEAGSDADRTAIGRSGLWADGRDSGGSCWDCRTPRSSCRWRSRTARSA